MMLSSGNSEIGVFIMPCKTNSIHMNPTSQHQPAPRKIMTAAAIKQPRTCRITGKSTIVIIARMIPPAIVLTLLLTVHTEIVNIRI